MTKIYNRTTEKAKRKELRNNMTPAEIILWSKLKDKGIGYKFRRQHSVGSFVLDFCCPVLKLAIEVDGDSHFSEDAIIRDNERQKVIENYGFIFLRFTNNEIVENVSGVILKIAQYIEKITTPTPPCQGGDKLRSIESKHSAHKGGEVAGDARKKLEKETKKKVVSSENYLTIPESRKRLERK